MATTTLYDILISTLRASGVLYEGEMPSSSKITNAQDAMNLMLNELSDLLIYATTAEDFDLLPGQADYTIGPSANLDTTRPTKLLDQCWVRDTSSSSNVDYPLRVIGEAQYNSIDIKNTQGIPEVVFYDPQYPLGILSFFYVPDRAYLFHCVSEKPLADITSLTAIIVLPPEYKAFLKWNTAKVLAADYPDLSNRPNYVRVILPMAKRSLGIVQRINAANRVEEAVLDCPKTKRELQDWRGPFTAGRTY